MIIVVSGSRGWTDINRIRDRLWLHKPELVVQGGARGADRLAKEVCDFYEIPCVTVKARWNEFGRAAGHKRNRDMLVTYDPDLVLIFWDGVSKGTKGMIDLANLMEYPMELHLQFSHE